MLHRLGAIAWEFLRDSLPERKRQRYGDVDYDWEHRVNTTGANVSWQARFIGLLTSSYQPIEPEIFREMLEGLRTDFREFTFVDIGSGKGRALLMASEYPFRRIVGVELLPELHRIAQENIQILRNKNLRAAPIESLCGDATEYNFPDEPLIVYLFHPLTETAFKTVIENLARSLRERPRAVRVIYANPIFEGWVRSCSEFEKLGGTHRYSLFRENTSGPTT